MARWIWAHANTPTAVHIPLNDARSLTGALDQASVRIHPPSRMEEGSREPPADRETD